MAKTTPPESAQPEAVSRDTSDDITLDEFCLRKSRSDKRVELIGGFYADEKREGKGKDSEANFASRFEAFVNKPV